MHLANRSNYLIGMRGIVCPKLHILDRDAVPGRLVPRYLQGLVIANADVGLGSGADSPFVGSDPSHQKQDDENDQDDADDADAAVTEAVAVAAEAAAEAPEKKNNQDDDEDGAE
jgi:hypothetical protein